MSAACLGRHLEITSWEILTREILAEFLDYSTGNDHVGRLGTVFSSGRHLL